MRLILLAVAVVTLPGVTRAQQCCTSDRWEGILPGIIAFEFEGANGVALADINIHYDYANKKLAVEDTVQHEGRSVYYKIIYDYQQRRQYTIRGSQNTSCETTTLGSSMFQYCVPRNATHQGSGTYGIGPNERLAFDAWEEDDKTSEAWHYSTTQSDCIPVSVFQMTRHPAGVSYVMSAHFKNVQQGIRNDAVFSPPSACSRRKQVAMVTVLPRRLQAVEKMLQHFMQRHH